MLTVQNIKDAFGLDKTDVTDVPADAFMQWVQFVVRFVFDKVKRVDPARYVKTSTVFTITTSPETESLPTDFGNMNQTVCGIYEYDTTELVLLDKKLGITGVGREDEGYYLEGASLIFTGCEDKSFYMKYMPVPPTIDDLTDYITVDASLTGTKIVEDYHLEYLVKAVDVLYEQWDRNPSGESLADFRFVRALGGLLDGFTRVPQVSVMSNPSEDF